MLEDAASSAPVGSKKWILVKSIYAFGRCRLHRGLDRIARDAYEQLLVGQTERFNSSASRAVNVALADFLKDFGSCKQHGVTRCAEGTRVLGRAVQLYLDRPELCHVELDFSSAVKELEGIDGAREALDDLVKGALDSQREPSYVVLKRSALVYKSWEPGRALKLLRQAEPLAPHEDADEMERFCGHLVDLLVEAELLQDAIVAQKTLMELTGRGQVRLMLLREQAGEKDAVSVGLAALDCTRIHEQELRRLFETLKAGRRFDMAQLALANYLQADRQREPGHELWARFRLAGLLVSDKKLAEARRIANTEHLKPPFNTVMARMYYRRLETLRRSSLAGKAKE